MYDSQIAEWGGIYRKLQTAYELYGARYVVDSVFAAGEYPYLMSNCRKYGDVASSNVCRTRCGVGMRAFQSFFFRLKGRLEYEEHGNRRLILEKYVLLFNLRLVGIDKLLSVYMPSLEQSQLIQF